VTTTTTRITFRLAKHVAGDTAILPRIEAPGSPGQQREHPEPYEIRYGRIVKPRRVDPPTKIN
jgi:hypothetical protein